MSFRTIEWPTVRLPPDDILLSASQKYSIRYFFEDIHTEKIRASTEVHFMISCDGTSIHHYH